MSRISVIQKMTARERSNNIEVFDYNKLTCINILALFTPTDIDQLYKIATSLKYNGDINLKYKMIDDIMRSRGFIRAHAGTNRIVYNYLEDSRFVAKVAIDRVGIRDSPKEYINQQYFAPFCCKIFEVHPSGVIAFVERVNPISSLEEFMSVADDIFNMMVTKILGKYVVDDLGTKAFMNFGIRYDSMGCMFGPVVIDYPYAYELDENKLICTNQIENPITHNKVICGGELDYAPGFNGIYCTKCGKKYEARNLAKDSSDCYRPLWISDNSLVSLFKHRFRAQIIDNGKVITDSGRESSTYISRKEFGDIMGVPLIDGMVIDLDKPVRSKRTTMQEVREKYYTDLRMNYFNKMQELEYKTNSSIGEVTKHSSDIEIINNDAELPKSINNKVFSNTEQIELILDNQIDLDDYTYNNSNAIKTSEITDVAVIEPQSNELTSNDSTNEELYAEPTEPSLDSQIVSDEVVESMVEDNKHRLDVDNADHSLDDVIDPERDKELPEMNPMNRIYHNANPDTLADYNPNSSEEPNPMDLAEKALLMQRPDKELGSYRYNNKQKDKRRNGYD